MIGLSSYKNEAPRQRIQDSAITEWKLHIGGLDRKVLLTQKEGRTVVA